MICIAPKMISQMPSTTASTSNEIPGYTRITMPASTLTTPITAFQPRCCISRWDSAVNTSTAPLTIQKMLSNSASASSDQDTNLLPASSALGTPDMVEFGRNPRR